MIAAVKVEQFGQNLQLILVSFFTLLLVSLLRSVNKKANSDHILKLICILDAKMKCSFQRKKQFISLDWIDVILDLILLNFLKISPI